MSNKLNIKIEEITTTMKSLSKDKFGTAICDLANKLNELVRGFNSLIDYLEKEGEGKKPNYVYSIGEGTCGTCKERECYCPERQSNGDWVESPRKLKVRSEEDDKLVVSGDLTPTFTDKDLIYVTPTAEWAGRWDEKFHQKFYDKVMLYEEGQIKSFIREEIAKAREEVLTDMKEKMEHWYGNSWTMIDDYKKKIS